MKPEVDFIPIGATYAPLAKAKEADISQWDQDLKNFRDIGLNTFRLFICWDRIEVERGKRDFSRVDYAFDLAEKYDLKVIVNMGGTFTNLQAIYPPRWLVYDENCTQRQETPGHYQKNDLVANRFHLCYDDPKYQELAREFIQCAVDRYKNRKSIIAWSGWNEPRISECYCQHTVEAFRDWLKNKYATIENLMEHWSTEFPVFFRDWNDVHPQPKASFEHGGYVPFLDWRAFLEYNRAAKFTLIKSWIKDIDPDTPVISHLAACYQSDIFGDEDILGTSIYTIHGDGHQNKPLTPEEVVSKYSVFAMNSGFRMNRKDPYGFWVVETEAGPISWVHDCKPRSYGARMMNARDILFMSFGARAILRWLYRSRISDAQAGEFNMVGWDGTITDRAIECGTMSQKVNEHRSVFQHHNPINHDILVLNVQSHNDYATAEGYKWRYHSGIDGLRNALRHMGYHPLFCNERQIQEGILDKAKILFCPHWIYLSKETEKCLRRFVENGGSLIVESPFGTKDQDCIHYEKTPGGMTDVFGATVWDLDVLGPNEKCGSLTGFDFHAKIRLNGATVEESFDNGDPAVISNTFGKGRAVLYASQISPVYQDNAFVTENGKRRFSDTAIRFHQELKKNLDKAGVAQQWETTCNEDIINHLHVNPRILPDGRKVFFVMNMDDKDHCYTLDFPGAKELEVLTCSDENQLLRSSNEYSFNLKDWGWTVLIEK